MKKPKKQIKGTFSKDKKSGLFVPQKGFYVVKKKVKPLSQPKP